MNFMCTASGGRYVFGKPNTIDIDDLALALARQPRFLGHTASSSSAYSVAQHSVHVSQLVPERMGLAALLHDAHEAYTGDMIVPLQRELATRLPGFKEALDQLQSEVQRDVHAAFGLPFPLDSMTAASIVAADLIMLRSERGALMISSEWTTGWHIDMADQQIVFPTEIDVWPAEEAYRRFKERLEWLVEVGE